jgi:hypothetical protein
MSRRMDREGVHRMEPQGIKNRRLWDDPRCKEDARGFVQPFANWQGWEEYNQANYALFCLLRWRPIRIRDMARVESDLRTFHFSLARSRKCDRPRLP